MNETPDSSDEKNTAPTALKPLAEEAFEELRSLIVPGKEIEAETRLEAFFVRETHQGPLPPARELAKYEMTLVGAANRIISMAEKEQMHRHELETRIVGKEGELKERGQLFALLGLTAMLAIVAWFGYLGQAVAGATLGGAVIVGVVAAFIGPRILQQGRLAKSDHTSHGSHGDTRRENSTGAISSVQTPPKGSRKKRRR